MLRRGLSERTEQVLDGGRGREQRVIRLDDRRVFGGRLRLGECFERLRCGIGGFGLLPPGLLPAR